MRDHRGSYVLFHSAHEGSSEVLYKIRITKKGGHELHNIGESLRELREERDLKQKEVADALYISNKLLSSYERGISQPPIDMLIRICEYYRVSADMLLGLKEQEEDDGPPQAEVSREDGPAEVPGLPSGEDGGVSGAPEDFSGDGRLAEDRRILGYYHRLDSESQEAIRGLLIYYCKEQEHRREQREAAETD
jgi:transcriptional regulator with XRE-family HTH domain